MVVFDASFLSLLLNPGAKPPLDPSTQKPVERARERIENLVSLLQERACKIIVPTPALVELLVLAGEAGPEYLAELNSSACFKISDFDQRTAVEVAAAIREAIQEGDKKSGATGTWAKVKFDRQIVAIAKVQGADVIYSDDEDIVRYASRVNISVVRVADLPMPPPEQMDLLPAGPADGNAGTGDEQPE